VSLGVTGDLAGKAHLFGKLKIEKAVDDKGTRLSREESPFTEDVTKGFISTQKSFGPKIENGFGFDIPLGSAKRGASNITQLKGSFLILSGTKSSVVIPDVASLAGKEAPNPELKAAHVTIKVESVEGNKVTYTMAGSVEAVLEVALVGADGQTIDTSNGSSSTDGGPTFYTMEASAMPANAGFKVALVTDATTTTIPFDLKNIPLP